MTPNILEVQNLKKYFPIRKGLLRRTTGHVQAVDGISFSVKSGETLGIVGESGCGKSTMGRMVMRLIEPTEGRIIFDGKDITKISGQQLRAVRPKFQMVFQDPGASLNPKQTVGQALAESMVVHRIANRNEADTKIGGILETVGLRANDRFRYPHEFSGGQRQRIGIARALTLNPKLIVADEAVSALDVSIQSQILNLMTDLRKEFNLSYIFISHDLSVVRHISDRVGVMYLGHLVEIADRSTLYHSPAHPYTKALLSAAPEPKRNNRRERIVLKGDVPSPSNPPSGCPFHTRCPEAMEICKVERPVLKEIAPGQMSSCHLY